MSEEIDARYREVTSVLFLARSVARWLMGGRTRA